MLSYIKDNPIMFKPTVFQPLPLPSQVQFVFVPFVLFAPPTYSSLPMLTYKKHEKKLKESIPPPHEWKNTTTLAIPTISVPPPIKITKNLSMVAPFSPISMLTSEEKSNLSFQRCINGASLSKQDYQAMATSISVAEFVLE
jgi:hypothetical protein